MTKTIYMVVALAEYDIIKVFKAFTNKSDAEIFLNKLKEYKAIADKSTEFVRNNVKRPKSPTPLGDCNRLHGGATNSIDSAIIWEQMKKEHKHQEYLYDKAMQAFYKEQEEVRKKFFEDNLPRSIIAMNEEYDFSGFGAEIIETELDNGIGG